MQSTTVISARSSKLSANGIVSSRKYARGVLAHKGEDYSYDIKAQYDDYAILFFLGFVHQLDRLPERYLALISGPEDAVQRP